MRRRRRRSVCEINRDAKGQLGICQSPQGGRLTRFPIGLQERRCSPRREPQLSSGGLRMISEQHAQSANGYESRETGLRERAGARHSRSESANRNALR